MEHKKEFEKSSQRSFPYDCSCETIILFWNNMVLEQQEGE